MAVITVLENWQDDQGNRIEFDGRVDANVKVKFTGSNNVLRIASPFRIGKLVIDFDCDNGLCEIGSSHGVPALMGAIRVGDGATIRLGDNVSTTTTVSMSAAEGATITLGDDVMIASDVQVRADDGHPIFDVRTGKRVNTPRDITIGSHVWLGLQSCVLGGAVIGDGTVIGMRSIVTRRLPNNVIAAGVPAKVVKRDIAWERPHLTLMKPWRKPDASTVKKSKAYWNLTDDPEGATVASRSRDLVAGARRKARRTARKVVKKVRTLT
ncbi:acyltransferase [Intrasporangium sp. YIM S08009]|uniref:acyltransferase n=1 Tax=Intrasporangium zincisolvens TaxID=3080018 RepID=UPI002B05BB22|nr:acyltransferase [Intrasporangium sp. YIM S08009]